MSSKKIVDHISKGTGVTKHFGWKKVVYEKGKTYRTLVYEVPEQTQDSASVAFGVFVADSPESKSHRVVYHFKEIKPNLIRIFHLAEKTGNVVGKLYISRRELAVLVEIGQQILTSQYSDLPPHVFEHPHTDAGEALFPHSDTYSVALRKEEQS